MKRLDREMLENISINSNENATDNSEQDILIQDISSSTNISTTEMETVSNQDENSNFAENIIIDAASITDSNKNNPKEDSSDMTVESVNSNTTFAENWDSEDKDIASDKENEQIREDTPTLNTQNINLPQESVPLSYIYKKNNERSNLQDFLREEAIKKTTSLMNIGTKQLTSLDTCLNNTVTLKDDDITKKIIGAIQRPKSLAIERIDNMTAAQANKLRVLMQEYGTTPNNNEFNTMFSNKRGIIDRTNVNDNNKILIDTINDTITVSTKENANNNVRSSTNAGSPNETATLHGSMDNEECSNKIDNTDNKEQESILNNAQNNIDTPMSCTTDNLTTLSIHTPSSQIPNSDDIFTLNAGQEISSLSDTGKSIIERTYLDSPMSNFKLPSLFGVSPDTKSSIMSSFLTIADVEMIDHTSLQVYLQKSVIIPLQIQTRLINHAVIKYLLNEHNMFSHLHSLRSYFFLLNGEFTKSLTDSLYSRLYTISAPIELFNSATLTNLLEKALMNSFSNNYANAELLSLSAIDKPCQLYVSNLIGQLSTVTRYLPYT